LSRKTQLKTSLKAALSLALLLGFSNVFAEESEPAESPAPESSTLSQEVEDLKKAALQLNRDLLILEEELLFPASTQIAVFLSLDIGKLRGAAYIRSGHPLWRDALSLLSRRLHVGVDRAFNCRATGWY